MEHTEEGKTEVEHFYRTKTLPNQNGPILFELMHAASLVHLEMAFCGLIVSELAGSDDC